MITMHTKSAFTQRVCMRRALAGFALLPFSSEFAEYPTVRGQGLSTDGSKYPASYFRGLRSVEGEPSGSNHSILSSPILEHPCDPPSAYHRTT